MSETAVTSPGIAPAETACGATAPRRPRPALALLALGGALALGGCETARSLNPFTGAGPQAGTPGFVRGFIGAVAADDPAAALTARNVLSAGGTAVDAAVAAGFTMAVTLPSRVGLGGGGACLAFDRAKGTPEAVLFLPGARSGPLEGADRPAALPLMARGMFLLHTRLGGRPFEELLASAEQAARFGTEVSRALANDLAAVHTPLFHDPNVRAVFATASGAPKSSGEQLVQPELAGTLGALRVAGAGDMNQGALARRIEDVSPSIGAGLTVAELRGALPTLAAPIILPTRGGDRIAFLPPPADGGLAAAASFTALNSGQSPAEALRHGLAAASDWRATGADPTSLLSRPGGSAAGMEMLPASAGLVVFDRNGNAVSCAFTMNNLFGTGRMAPGMGFLMAMAPNSGHVRPPLLAAALAYNPNIRSFRAAAAGAGQQDAGMAVAGPAYLDLMRGVAPAQAVEQGSPAEARSQYAACLNYMPGRPDRCAAVSDPRGTGVALGTADQ